MGPHPASHLTSKCFEPPESKYQRAAKIISTIDVCPRRSIDVLLAALFAVTCSSRSWPNAIDQCCCCHMKSLCLQSISLSRRSWCSCFVDTMWCVVVVVRTNAPSINLIDCWHGLSQKQIKFPWSVEEVEDKVAFRNPQIHWFWNKIKIWWNYPWKQKK